MKELETPPAEPVDWYVFDRCAPSGAPVYTVKARTWYIARDEGARVLGVDRYQVTCQRAST